MPCVGHVDCKMPGFCSQAVHHSSHFPPWFVQLSLWWTLLETGSQSIRSGDILSAYAFLSTGSNVEVGYIQGVNGVMQVGKVQLSWSCTLLRREGAYGQSVLLTLLVQGRDRCFRELTPVASRRCCLRCRPAGQQIIIGGTRFCVLLPSWEPWGVLPSGWRSVSTPALGQSLVPWPSWGLTGESTPPPQRQFFRILSRQARGMPLFCASDARHAVVVFRVMIQVRVSVGFSSPLLWCAACEVLRV